MIQGEAIWTPPADWRQRFEMGRYLDWLQLERGLDFAGYDELWRWSVSDIEGFWASIWDYFGVRAHTPYERVLGSREMPGAEWFPGATLNFAEHLLGRDDDLDNVAIVAHSQTRKTRELTFGELREQVARARAGLKRLGVGPGDRVVAYLPNIPETAVAFLATASLGAVWATCPPDFGVRSVVDRLGQLDPTVLLAVSGYVYGEKLIDRAENVAAIRDRLLTLQTVVDVEYAGGAIPGAISWDERSWASQGLSSSIPCRSHTPSTFSSHPARQACRRRSCTATAGSCSSTSRTSGSPGTCARVTGSSGSRRPRG
jgi:acetoacetyl-CoA synthetase